MSNLKNKFISFEGVEGVGKSTQVQLFVKYLHQQGIKAKFTREPGGTVIAEQLRQIVLNAKDEAIHQSTELLLMFAARAQHLHNFILPTIKAGNTVVCDRFIDSTYAYQGGGRKMQAQHIQNLEGIINIALPQLTILLVTDNLQECLQRAQKVSCQSDRIEAEKLDFFNRVQQNFLERAHNYPERIKVINADADKLSVQNEINLAVKSHAFN